MGQNIFEDTSTTRWVIAGGCCRRPLTGFMLIVSTLRSAHSVHFINACQCKVYQQSGIESCKATTTQSVKLIIVTFFKHCCGKEVLKITTGLRLTLLFFNFGVKYIKWLHVLYRHVSRWLNFISNIAHSFFYILSVLGATVVHLVKSY